MEDGLEHLSEKAMLDFKLVQKAIHEKDQQAYAKLMDRYRDSIYFMLLKMVNNKDDADDLTIEAFGKAFKNLHQYTPNYAFSTWLFKIASNNCIDFIRKKKKNMLSIDRRYENDEGGVVVDAEGGVRRDAKLLQGDEGSHHRRHACNRNVDGVLDPIDIDTEAR